MVPPNAYGRLQPHQPLCTPKRSHILAAELSKPLHELLTLEGLIELRPRPAPKHELSRAARSGSRPELRWLRAPVGVALVARPRREDSFSPALAYKFTKDMQVPVAQVILAGAPLLAPRPQNPTRPHITGICRTTELP